MTEHINKLALRSLLEGYSTIDKKENEHLVRMRWLLEELREPLSRAQSGAHFTASAILVHPAGTHICLVYHAKTGRWLQPGGHMEPEDGGSAERAALREVHEETGCSVRLHPAAPRPLDVDVHPIPVRATEAEHLHLDIRFLAIADNPAMLTHDSSESFGARWLTWNEALAQVSEPGLRRLLQKARKVVSV